MWTGSILCDNTRLYFPIAVPADLHIKILYKSSSSDHTSAALDLTASARGSELTFCSIMVLLSYRAA
jgi:hypothetical protein